MIVKFDALNRFEKPLFYVCNPGCVYNTADGTLTNAIGALSNTTDEELIMNFNTTSELNFRIYRVDREDADEQEYVYKLYKSLQNRRLIFVEDLGFFVITDVTSGYENRTYYKDVRAESCEAEISWKMLPYIADGTYPLLTQGTDTGILNMIVSSLPLWTIGSVDSTVASKYRTFEDVSADTNSYEFMLSNLQDAYECLFIFDIVKRRIHVYDQNNYVVGTDIHITNDDLIDSIEVKEDSESVFTAISVFGDDELNIVAVNPLGTNVIYNFDYYLDWMTPSLASKVRTWSNLVESLSSDYVDKNTSYHTLLDVSNEYQHEIECIETQISTYTTCRENIVASSKYSGEDESGSSGTEASGSDTGTSDGGESTGSESTVSTVSETETSDSETTNTDSSGSTSGTGNSFLQTALDAAQRVITACNVVIEENDGTPVTLEDNIADTLAEIDVLIADAKSQLAEVVDKKAAVDAEIASIEADITAIHESVAIDTYFTASEYDELFYYIYEGSYTDTYVAVTDSMTYSEKLEQKKLLYNRAVAQLERISKPTQEFSIDVENFVFEKNFEHWSEQLETGCVINVELDRNDIAALFLATITINWCDAKLELTFGNRLNRLDPKALFDGVLGDVKRTSNSLNFIKDVIYPIKNGELDAVKVALGNSRLLTMSAALSSTNQEVTIDETGYTGRSLDENGEYEPEQIKITGSSIVFTDDSWETCKTAIGKIILDDDTTIYGVNAQALIGDIILGSELHIVTGGGGDLGEIVSGTVSNSVTEYYSSTSRTELIDGEWVTEAPADEDGRYIWIRTRIEYTSGDVSYSDPVCITGESIEGISSYLHVKYSDDGVTFTDDFGEVVGAYMGTCVTNDPDDPMDFNAYKWVKIKGDDGDDGIPGEGRYFHVKYSEVENPTAEQMLEVPAKYIGTYVDGVLEDSTDPADYEWIKFTGEDGIPGEDGEDGKTYYLHIKYSNDGGETFTAEDGEASGDYIGVYTDTVQEDSTNVDDYTWSLIKGKDGIGIENVVNYYYACNLAEGVTADHTLYNWTEEIQAMDADHPYLWNYEVIKYSTEDTSATDPMIIGRFGEDGVGIASIEEKYIASQTNIMPDLEDPDWSDKPYEIETETPYLWCYEIITYTDGSVHKTDPRIIGVHGQDGKDGVSSFLHVKYANADADGNLSFTANNGEDVGEYMGTCTTEDEEDPDNFDAYKWVKIKGEAGKDGIPGESRYFHVKFSEVESPTTTEQLLETPAKYIGTYVDDVSEDSTDPADYAWVQFMGNNGIKGEDGEDGKTYYLHIKYANMNSSGNMEFTTDSGNGVGEDVGEYIGVYTDTLPDDSTDVDTYKWSLMAGKDGISVTKIENYYWASSMSSGVDISTTNDWTDDVSHSNATMTSTKKYLWNYEVIHYSSGDSVASDPIVIGRYGTDGSPGNGISSITEYYLTTTEDSNITWDSLGWDTNVEAISTEKPYLWCYEVIEYTSGDPYKSTPRIIGVHGQDGDKGEQGFAGTGIDSAVTMYINSADDTTAPDSTADWKPTIPDPEDNKPYLWTKTVLTLTDGSTQDVNFYCVTRATVDSLVSTMPTFSFTSEGLKITQDGSTATFTVEPNGKLTATGAEISGTLKAGTIEAGVEIITPVLESAIINSSELNSTTVNTATLNSPEINIDNTGQIKIYSGVIEYTTEQGSFTASLPESRLAMSIFGGETALPLPLVYFKGEGTICSFSDFLQINFQDSKIISDGEISCVTLTSSGDVNVSDRVLLRATDDDRGNIKIFHLDGELGVNLYTTDSGGEVDIYDSSAVLIGALYAAVDGGGYLMLGNSSGDSEAIGYDDLVKLKNLSTTGGTSDYTLPTADSTTLGGVKIGSNINISNGIISVADASTSTKGVVQLEDSITSTSTTTAATPSSVKVTYDLASSAQTRADNAYDLAELKTDIDEVRSEIDTRVDQNSWGFAYADDIPTVDGSLSTSSTNPVQNKVIASAIGSMATVDDVATIVRSQGYTTEDDVNSLIEANPSGFTTEDRVEDIVADGLVNNTMGYTTLTDVQDAIAYALNTNDQNFAYVSDIPTVSNSTITITQGGTTKGTFTLNQSGNSTIALDAGGSGTSDYTLPAATSTTLGGVIVGDNIDVSDGTISVKSATYNQPGVVQLSLSTSSTSITTAATPYAVKRAYDLANDANTLAEAALPTSGGTVTGALTANSTLTVNGNMDIHGKFTPYDGKSSMYLDWTYVVGADGNNYWALCGYDSAP